MGKDKRNIAKANVITQDVIDFVLAHKDDFPRKKYIAMSGVCSMTFYKILKKYGNVVFPKRDVERDTEIIKECYPLMSASEIHGKYNIPKNIIKKIVKEFNLRHTEETEIRLKEKRIAAMKIAIKDIDRVAIVNKWKKTRRLEEIRLLSGMPQKTGIYICPLNKKARTAKHNLISKYKYFSSLKQPFTLYYDSLPQRVINRQGAWARFDEEFYSKEYGFKFEPADDE